MRIVVVGASRLGVALVAELLEHHHDVVLVDQSRDQLDQVSERLDCGFIEGDGTLPQILRDAYGDAADALVLLTNHDDVNILAAVVGRSIGYERVVLQIVRSELLEVCEELGFDEVVTPHATVAQSISSSINSHSRVWSQMDSPEGLEFASYVIKEDREGQTLDSLDLPEGARAVARLREDEPAETGREVTLSDGDKVLVAANEASRKELDKMFGAEA